MKKSSQYYLLSQWDCYLQLRLFYIIIMSKSARESTANPAYHRFSTPSNPFYELEHEIKDKNQQYLTPRQPNSAQSSRTHYNQNKDKENGIFNVKLQIKTPIMTPSINREQMKTRINRLGLQNFMKQIVLADKIPDPDLSSKVIYAMNKTYLASNIEAPQQKMLSSFGPKSLRYSRRAETPKVQWNPENSFPQQQFKQFNSFIPNTMFPCRKGKTTRLLKSRQKTRRQNSCDSFLKPEKPNIEQLIRSSQNCRVGFSLNLQKNRRKNGIVRNNSYSRRWSSSRLNNTHVQSIQRINQKKLEKQSSANQQYLYAIKKAKIYQ